MPNLFLSPLIQGYIFQFELLENLTSSCFSSPLIRMLDGDERRTPIAKGGGSTINFKSITVVCCRVATWVPSFVRIKLVSPVERESKTLALIADYMGLNKLWNWILTNSANS